MIKHLENEKDFQEEIKDGLVLVDFYADWCGPCQMLIPNLEQLERETGIKILKINTNIFQDIAIAFRIMSIPTLLLFENGKLIKKDMGYMPIERLKSFVSKS